MPHIYVKGHLVQMLLYRVQTRDVKGISINRIVIEVQI